MINGTFSYSHDGSATTTDVFYYRPTDGLFPGNTTTVTIYINNPALGVGDTIICYGVRNRNAYF